MTGAAPQTFPDPRARRERLEAARRAFEDMARMLDDAVPQHAEPRTPVPSLPSLLERCEEVVARDSGRGAAGRRALAVFPGLAGLDAPTLESRLEGTLVFPLTVRRDPATALHRQAVAAALDSAADVAARGGRDLLVLTEAAGCPTFAGQDGALVLACHPRQAHHAHRAALGAAALPLGAFCDLLARSCEGRDILRVEDAGTTLADIVAALAARLGLRPRPLPPRARRRAAVESGIGGPTEMTERDVAPYRALCARLGYDPDAARAPAPPAPAIRDRAARPAHPVLVFCHHKSGTNFLIRTFRAIARRFEMRLWTKFYDPRPETGWDICFHQHARMDDAQFEGNFRGVHCIRHPMALVHSAALYHANCKEPWVDVPLDRFTEATFRALSDRATYNEIKHPDTPMDRRRTLMSRDPAGAFDSGYAFEGRTYRQMLTARETTADRLRFEMRGFSYGVVRDMVRFPLDARFRRITLEEISHDRSMSGLERMFRHLGFAGTALRDCLEIAEGHCLWNLDDLPGHATTGVSDAWRAAFAGEPIADFRTLFGWPEEALGYPAVPGGAAP